MNYSVFFLTYFFERKSIRSYQWHFNVNKHQFGLNVIENKAKLYYQIIYYLRPTILFLEALIPLMNIITKSLNSLSWTFFAFKYFHPQALFCGHLPFYFGFIIACKQINDAFQADALTSEPPGKSQI